MKRSIVFLVVLLFVIVFVVIMNLLVQGNFQVKNIYYGAYEELGDSKESFMNSLTDEYNVSRSEAEELYESKDIMKINIGYTITNKSLLPMYVSKTVFCNDSRVFVCVEKPESQSKCYVSAGESTTLNTSIILRKSDFTREILEDMKIYALTIGASPLVKLELNYDIELIDTLYEASRPDEEFPELFEHEKKYYLPYEADGEALTLNDFNDNTRNIHRFYSASNKLYCIDRFEYENISYYGVAFFDEDGLFQKGMAIHKVFDDESDFRFQIGVSTIEDVRAVDGGSLRFIMSDGTVKTYHYFKDGTCIEITYVDNVILEISEFSVGDMFSNLIPEDVNSIQGNETE